MTKKRSKSLFVIFSIILVVCLVACFVSFTYPLNVGSKVYSYSSFISNVKLGEDVGNSLRIVYRADLPENESQANYNNLTNATIDNLKQIVQSEGYKDVSVAKYGEDGISVQIGNILTDSDVSNLKSLIGSPAAISFSTNQDGTNPIYKRECVENVYATSTATTQGSAAQTYFVVIDFKDDYVDELVKASEENTIYIFLGETQFSSIEKGNLTEQGIISFSSEEFKSMQDATTIANQIKTGLLPLELTQIDSDMITPSYGIGADILLPIVMAILAIAGFAFLIIKYKDMGWLACFNLLFFVTIGLFLIQSIPLAHVNFAGMIGLMVGLIVSIDSLMTVFERAKKHYNEDTKLYIAFRMAFKETWLKVVIENCIVLLTGFICLFMPNMAIQSFGWVAFVLPFVSMFTSLVLMRLFVKMYLALNSINGKKCNFHKGGQND